MTSTQVATPKSAYEFMEFFGSEYTAYKKERKAAGGMMLIPNKDLTPDQHLELIDTLKVNQEDAYFIVNPGGMLAKDIKRPTACFIDLDAGRDANKHYWPLKDVQRFKGDCLGTLARFSNLLPAQPIPTAIVETRNGFQLYWKLDDDKFSIRRWNKVQHQIAYYFQHVGADNRVLKPNQVLRLPFSTWFKTYEEGGHDPFDVNLYDFSGRSYSFGLLADTVSKFPEITKHKWDTKCKSNANSPKGGPHTISSAVSSAKTQHGQTSTTNAGKSLVGSVSGIIGALLGKFSKKSLDS